jgi:2-polyprenyl-3-methyl-5-hydroxy-6-metoxy-1,4-benzoquinol methylase
MVSHIPLSGALQAAQNPYPDVQSITIAFFDQQISSEIFDIVVSEEVIEHLEDQARESCGRHPKTRGLCTRYCA